MKLGCRKVASSRFSGALVLLLLFAIAACSDEPQGKKTCPGDQIRCGDACVQVEIDAQHCGSCDNPCGEDEICVSGSCTSGCDEGLYACGGSCVDPWSDPEHCGACNSPCPVDEVCSEGRCAPTCAPGLTPCGRACQDLWGDPRNCGSCGNACGSGQRCVDGTCSCGPGLSPCAGGCVDLQKDAKHCGACGASCNGDNVVSGICDEGTCTLFCAPGFLDCDGEAENGCEVDSKQDAANCGACGITCGEGLACVDGACACPPGTTECDGACVDLESDPEHCGSCETNCKLQQNVISATCEAGVCVPTCLDGWGACGEEPGCTTRTRDNVEHCGGCGKACVGAEICDSGSCYCPIGAVQCEGICTDIAADVANCGACGRDCTEEPYVTAATCFAGLCMPTCLPGAGNCDPEAPGCETNLNTDPAHCGQCNIECRPDQICNEGKCVCPPDHLECDGLCRPILTDNLHCGGCGQSCIDQPNAVSGQCMAGSCSFVCAPGYDDCDPNAPGCETHLPSDPEHCGSCSKSCRPNDVCIDSSCVCPPDKTDCGSACTDLEVDERHCGACDHACDPGQVCEEFTCYEPCPGGQTHCGGVCFDLQTDVEHCGTCQMNCTQLPQVDDATCVAAACVIDCQDGWADCNEEAVDGCEIDVVNDSSNCGACGVVCPDEHHCAEKTCVCDDPELSSCDGFCVNFQSDAANCGDCGNACGIRCDEGACLNVALIAKKLGYSYTMAVDTQGKLYTWGENKRGELGIGASGGFETRPVPVDLPAPVVDVASGASNTDVTRSTCAVLANGEVYCWGDNSRGQAGTAATDNPQTTPVPIMDGEEKLSGAVAIGSASGAFCAAVLPDRKVKCWGFNASGILGYTGQPSISPTPVDLPDLRDVERISGGESFFCALVTGGDVYCWGSNSSGKLGIGGSTPSSSHIPLKAALRRPAVDISTSYEATCAVLDNGEVDCWGRASGILGFTSSTSSPTHRTISGVTGATQISLSFGHACARLANGQARCWGSNASGQLGLGTSDSNQHTSGETVLLDGQPLTGIQSIHAGSGVSCALLDGGSMRCWGANAHGRLGTGDTTPRLEPTSPLW